jgi:hypothetical protein
MKPYKFTMIRKHELEDCPRRKTFCKALQAEMDNDETIAERVAFSYEATFHTSGKVNRNNLRTWSTQNHATLEHQRHSPKVNVYCALSRSQVHGPFFFAENTVKGINYLYMLQNWLLPQLTEHDNTFITGVFSNSSMPRN